MNIVIKKYPEGYTLCFEADTIDDKNILKILKNSDLKDKYIIGSIYDDKSEEYINHITIFNIKPL